MPAGADIAAIRLHRIIKVALSIFPEWRAAGEFFMGTVELASEGERPGPWKRAAI